MTEFTYQPPLKILKLQVDFRDSRLDHLSKPQPTKSLRPPIENRGLQEEYLDKFPAAGLFWALRLASTITRQFREGSDWDM